MRILTHQHHHISHHRQTILLIDQRVGGPSEDYIRDQLGLLIDASVLPDGYCHSEVVVFQVRSQVFISHDHIQPYDSILRAFGLLEEQVDISVHDLFQLFLRSPAQIFIFFILGDLHLLLGRFGIRFPSWLLGVCLLWGRRLLFLFLLLFFLFGGRAFHISIPFGLSPQLLQLYPQVCRIQVLRDLLKPIRNVSHLAGGHEDVDGGEVRDLIAPELQPHQG
mmetsp:Transcript_9422/g.8925  ORF Transcript_9422/g.8925 Transcript_9422/m.8925 type:complete len:221 (+) Transcript_9422:3540-4202(+)